MSAALLVEKGKPAGEFVLSDRPAQAEVFGTNDICGWIEKITGAKVPILRAASEKANEKVFVGTAYAGEFKKDLARLEGNDGYAVRRKGNSVYVFGSRPRGTLYGLYALLQKNTDIIFARPDDTFGTVHGQAKDLSLKEADFIDVPVFLNRWLGPGWPRHRPTGMWLLRNRDNRRDLRASYKGFEKLDLIEAYNRTFASPISSHAKDHPEYFGWDPITRTRRFVRHGEGTMCLTTPGLPAIWARGLADMVAAHEKKVGRNVDNVRIGPGDNWFCCQCTKCLAPIALPNGTTLACKDPDSIKDPLFRSTQIFMFINEAMKTWQELRPDIPLHVLAYIHFAEPPRVKLHPKMGIYFAAYPTNNMHFPLLDPRQSAVWRRRFAQWLKVRPCLGFYEYYFSKPTPLGFYAAANLRAIMRCPDYKNAIVYCEMDNDRGARGIGENRLGWDVGLMNMWVITRLFWDPTQDVDALYHYYIKRTFREAAPQMLVDFELIKASWLAPDTKAWDGAHGSIAGNYDNLIVKRGLEGKCLKLLADAEKTAKHPNSKVMIRRMREQYAGFSKRMARLIVPAVPEMKADRGAFDSLQWEKAPACDDFKVTTRTATAKASSETTAVKAAHDGKNLYIRFTASDKAVYAQNATQPVAGEERWPQGDHIEFWISGGRDRYVLALNANGASYDAKNLDRRWQSGWEVKTRKLKGGWEAIVVIPMSAFNLVAGKETHFRWFCTREISRADGSVEHVSYQGLPLYYRNFPIIIQSGSGS